MSKEEEKIMYSREKAIAMRDYTNKHGLNEASSFFDVKHGTIERATRKLNEKAWTTPPKILIFDIETAPCEGYFWQPGKQFVGQHQIKKDWYIICWSAKWFYGNGVISDCVTPEEALERNDKRVVENLVALLEEADITVTHNGDSFDIKKVAARRHFHKILKPSPFVSIDTYKESKKIANFSSHSQAFLTRHVGAKQKIATSFNLWVRCVNGEQEALDEMNDYCRNDVIGLEGLFVELSPEIKIGNAGFYADVDWDVCPSLTCGGTNLVEMNTPHIAQVNSYKAYRCLDCGAQGRSRKSSKAMKPKLVRMPR